MIIKEIAEVKNQLSQLNLFWLDEQRRIIEQLKEEILALNKEKDAKNVQRGNLESRIHQLEYEILPEKYQQYEAIEDVLNEGFTKEYRETIGVPRYRQELVRLKRCHPQELWRQFGAEHKGDGRGSEETVCSTQRICRTVQTLCIPDRGDG